MSISISSLTIDMALYPRKRVDQARVERYAAAMRRGEKFPPIKIAHVEGNRVVLDGVHRIKARQKAGYQSVDDFEDLGTMTRTEAFASAVRFNAVHGKSLTGLERLVAYKRLVDEGYSIEKAQFLISMDKPEIKSSVNPQKESLITQIKKLKTLLDTTEMVLSDTLVPELRWLRNRIAQRYDSEVVSEMKDLQCKIDKLLKSLK